ncbi:MAG: GTP-binding protein [Ilumatobacteraceae bacterium]
MSSIPTERIRNVALVGHSGAGTTTLAEALLARAGAVARAGKVDDGTSVLDTEPESVKRKISLSLSLAPFEWKATDGETYKVNLLDTPGYPDFIGEVEAALSVADLAVFVVSAVDGVQVQTEMLWRRAAQLGLPRMVFVSKEDKERADFHRVLDQLRATLGHGFIPLELPLGEAQTLHGIADVLSEQAYEYEPGGTHHSEALPADVADEEHQLHDAAIEEIVSGNDEQLERYLSGEVPTVAELESSLAREVLDCLEFPVLLGSAHTGVGVDRLADFICELGPSPADRPAAVQAGEGDAALAVNVPADASANPLAYVFKTITDPFVGQLSIFKVLSGTLATDQHLLNARSNADERLHALFSLRGKEQTPVNNVVAGDIAAVAKLANTHTGDTLAPKGTPVRVASVPGPVSQYGVSVIAATQADDDKLGTALAKLQSEDPLLLVDRVEETHQTVLRGFGDTHVSVTLERLAREVRGQRQRRAGARPVPRNGVRARRRAGPGEEADRRSRPVRRGQHEGVGAESRRGLRVRRLHRGRGHPAQLHPGGAEGHRGDHGPRRGARLPGGRRACRVLRRQVPRRGLQRDGVQVGCGAGLQGGPRSGRVGGPGAHFAAEGHRAQRPSG